MGDSNAMTIDFLRARLLSERTVSRTARQRAEELAQRVAELEEQLRIVTIQRKKAEKATVDVLAILEKQGITDASEEYYTNSDIDETPRSLKKANGFAKEEESSVGSKQLVDDLDNFSFPEVDSSRVLGSSLSWKGRKDYSRALEMYKEASVRRRYGLSSVGKPSKHRPGKSCRQTRQSEQSSEASDGISSSQQPNHGNDKFSKSGGVCLNSGEKQPQMLSDNIEFHKEKGQFLEDEINAATPLHDECKESGPETNMEEALEHQAQLICQYEAMERAQREWEDNFGGNNNNTLEPCDPGNHSDVTEEAEEKTQALQAPIAVMVPAAEAKLEVGDASATQMSPQIQHKLYVPVSRPNNGDSVVSLNNQEVPSKTSGAPYPVTTSIMPNANGKNEILNFCNQPPLKTSSTSHIPISCDTLTEQIALLASTLHRGETSTDRGESKALVPHGPTVPLAGVLDSLKQAKLMLQKQIARVPSSDNGTQRSTMQRCFLKPESAKKVDIPGGLSGLFKLSSDISLRTTPKSHVPLPLSLSGTQLSSAYLYPGDRATLSSSNPSMRNHCPAINPGFRMDDQLISGQFFGAGPGTMHPNNGMNSYQDMNAHAHSHYHPYPNAMPRMLSYDGAHGSAPASGAAAPAVSQFDPMIYNNNLYTSSPMNRQ